MNITVGPSIDNVNNEMIHDPLSVEIFAFVTNDPIDKWGNEGYLGMGICPPELAEAYSFRHNLAKAMKKRELKDSGLSEEKQAKALRFAYISSMEWVMNKTRLNHG